MRLALLALLLFVGGGLAWIRLAPSDRARWDVDLVPSGTLPEGGVVTEGGGARAAIRLTDETPMTALARLDRIALTTARTRRLAGDPQSGRITWITRSAVFGFPDYTTASARAAGRDCILLIHARQRFGRSDFGVNAARLRDWITRLAP